MIKGITEILLRLLILVPLTVRIWNNTNFFWLEILLYQLTLVTLGNPLFSSISIPPVLLTIAQNTPGAQFPKDTSQSLLSFLILVTVNDVDTLI